MDDNAKQQPPQKNYRVKNSQWHCHVCDVYCNSQTQFDVHMISQKHKLSERKQFSINNSFSSSSQTDESEIKSERATCDENNNLDDKPKIDIHNFDLAESHKINARKYLIPESKRVGKFEKFGFYCATCNAYMTGQIQLVMHVKGAKHQYFSPGEIPGYIPSKVYNPSAKSKFMRPSALEQACAKPHVSLTIKREPQPCSTPVKTSQTNYADYLLKNQSLMQQTPYYRYYNNYHQTPFYNQYNQQPYTSPSPPNPAATAAAASYYGQFQASPPNLLPNYQISQPYRIFPSQSSLIVLKNDIDSKSSSYSSNSDCLNRSFEKTYPAYNQNFDSPVFNVQSNTNAYTNQLQLQSSQSPSLSHQMFYSKNSILFQNSQESSTCSTSPHFGYYQNYSIIS